MVNNEWDILDLYFKDHKYPFTGHHLDSYRDFIKNQIPYIIKSYNPITMIKYDDSQNMKMKVDVYIGGEDGDDIYIDRPTTYEDGTPKLITPNDARMRNLTYETHIFAKVFVRITTDDVSNTFTKNFNNVAIGSIPIMLHSDACILKNQGSNILRKLGECPYDMGGYFIIDGKEKVIIAQEKIVTNKLFVNILKDDPDGFGHKGIIRCVADKGALAPRSVEFFHMKHPNVDTGLSQDDKINNEYETSKKYIHGSIHVSLPSFNCKIPLFILFRALGIESDKDIYNTIFGNNLSDNEKNYFNNFIRPTVISSNYTHEDKVYNIFTQEEAINYLKFKVTYATVEHVKSVLTMDVFPNIDDFDNKGKYLGYLVLQFIKSVKDILPLSDRDSYIYKRVDISGFMLAELFQEAYQKLRDNTRNWMDSTYYYGSWKQQDNYDNFINDNNIYKLINSMAITETFGKSLKGRWGLVSNEDPELGKVQDLSRISYIGFMSHLRRVNIPIDRSIKVTGPHRLHSQQWGMMCPFESPDGGSVGYLKNLALLAKITAGIDVENIKECLIDIGVIPLIKCNIYSNKNITNVFINSTLFGITGDPIFITRILKAYRRNGLINILISISWNINMNELRIFTEAGRPCRPLLILKRNKNTKTNEVVVYKNHCTNWFDMLNGQYIKLKDSEKTDDYYYRDIYINPLDPDNKYESKGGYDSLYDNSYYSSVYSGGEIIKDITKQIMNISGGKKDKKVADVNVNIENEESDDDIENDSVIGDTDMFYRKKYNKILKVLEKSISCIEYLDNEETDTSLIAMTKEEITPYHTHLEIHASTILSVVSGNIPMCNHNQSVRNVFHAAQSKQAIGIYATNFNNRFDTMSYILHYPQRAIINTRISQYTSSDYMANGYNTIVAIMTYSGFNQEDSIMINKASIQRGLNSLSYYKSITATSKIISINERIIFGNPITMKEGGIKVLGIKKKDYSFIDEKGFINKGTYIPQGQEVIIVGMLNVKDVYKEVKRGVFIEQVKETIYTDVSISTDNSLYGTVDKVYVSNKLAGEDSIICKVRFLKIKKPEYGDKHSSRHGQKGVIGIIIPEENMPFTKDGVRPDIIINPHAIPSRMTIGHLVECIFAKVCCLDGLLGDATVFIPIENEAIYKRLEDNGFNKYGNEILYNGFTGKQIESEIFIGPTYYFRLKHMVAEKLNARGVGKLTGLTRQPTEGRRRGGGLRIGEMERDTVLSHGISLFIKESMMERSDKYTWCACKRCGTLVAFNTKANINTCKNCNNDDITFVQTPYAFKLLIQELEAMGIQLRVNTEDIDLPLEQIDIQRYNGDDDDIANNEDIIDTIEYYDDYVDNFDNPNMIKDDKVWKDIYDKHFEKKIGGFNTENEIVRDTQEKNSSYILTDNYYKDFAREDVNNVISDVENSNQKFIAKDYESDDEIDKAIKNENNEIYARGVFGSNVPSTDSNTLTEDENNTDTEKEDESEDEKEDENNTDTEKEDETEDEKEDENEDEKEDEIDKPIKNEIYTRGDYGSNVSNTDSDDDSKTENNSDSDSQSDADSDGLSDGISDTDSDGISDS